MSITHVTILRSRPLAMSRTDSCAIGCQRPLPLGSRRGGSRERLATDGWCTNVTYLPWRPRSDTSRSPPYRRRLLPPRPHGYACDSPALVFLVPLLWACCFPVSDFLTPMALPGQFPLLFPLIRHPADGADVIVVPLVVPLLHVADVHADGLMRVCDHDVIGMLFCRNDRTESTWVANSSGAIVNETAPWSRPGTKDVKDARNGLAAAEPPPGARCTQAQ